MCDRFDGKVVAKLPFTPFSVMHTFTHRNILGDDFTDCGMLFICITTNLNLIAFADFSLMHNMFIIFCVDMYEYLNLIFSHDWALLQMFFARFQCAPIFRNCSVPIFLPVCDCYYLQFSDYFCIPLCRHHPADNA